MKVLFSLFFIFFMFSTASFAYLLWEFETNAPCSTKPVFIDNNILITSQDGRVYLLSPDGMMIWKKDIGKYPLQPLLFGSNIILATTTGRILEVQKNGVVVREFQFDSLNYSEQVYGVTTTPNNIYLTTLNALILVQKVGAPSIIYSLSKNATVVTPPAATIDNIVVFGVDNQLFAVQGKKLKWKTTIGTIWTSRPLIESEVVYIGTIDDILYAVNLNSGSVKWSKNIDGWIVGDLIIDGTTLYFGTTNGYLYSIDSTTSGIVWKASAGSGLSSTPVKGTLGEEKAIFIGSDDGNLYVFRAKNGELLWKWAAKGKVNSPSFNLGNVILPSSDNSIYALNTDKACTITEPKDGTTIGHKEILIKGIVLASGTPNVYVRLEGGEWKKATVNGSNWEFLLDPTLLPNGFNIIECRVGDEEDVAFSSLLLNRDTSLPLNKFKVSYPSSVGISEWFNISVADEESGLPVETFTAIVGGKSTKQTGSGYLTLKFNDPGKIIIVIKKIGFKDYSITTDVKKGGLDIIPIAIGAIILLALIYFYFYIYKRR